jgi:hypothetical protein
MKTYIRHKSGRKEQLYLFCSCDGLEVAMLTISASAMDKQRQQRRSRLGIACLCQAVDSPVVMNY